MGFIEWIEDGWCSGDIPSAGAASVAEEKRMLAIIVATGMETFIVVNL